MKNTVSTLNTTKAMARAHVVFSTTSVVFLTPMIWFEDEKLEARPPPFDSWINTIKHIKMEITIVKTRRIVYIDLIICFCY